MNRVLTPGATIGVLGSGQLGRMLGIAAKQMGYFIHTYSPDKDTPAGQVCDREIVAAYEDLEALAAFGKTVDVVTLEFENIPVAALNTLEQYVPVRPGPAILHIAQHRLREKTFLAQSGFPVVPFRPVRSVEELGQILTSFPLPAVLKTAGFGYDGKGQAIVHSAAEAHMAFNNLGGQEAVLEKRITLQKEFSVIAARSWQGHMAVYQPIENVHRNHILDISSTPADIPMAIAEQAVAIIRELMDTLGYVGLLCVEFFLTDDDQLYINELAPRPHNSGHLTIEAAVTSQFEQQLRAICGLPLGSTDFVRPAAMANLLGDVWSTGEPIWNVALQQADVKLHLYGKAEARPGRKMGHLTALGRSPAEAIAKVSASRNRLMQAQPIS